MTPEPLVSVVIPVSERHEKLPEFIDGCRQALEDSGRQVEFFCVLDGKFPELAEGLRQIQQSGVSLTVIQLARNFGEATALKAGFDAAGGELLLILPAYPQVAAESVPALVDALGDSDMAVAVRWPRRDVWLNRLQGRAFNRLVTLLTGETFRDLGCGARALRREVVENVQVYGEQYRFLPILAAGAGYRVSEVELPQTPEDQRRRIYSPGTYLRRLLDVLAVLFLVKFTKKPLRFFGVPGALCTLAGGVVLAYLVVERLLGLTALAERPAFLLGALVLVLGVQLFAIGLLGELIIFTHSGQAGERDASVEPRQEPPDHPNQH